MITKPEDLITQAKRIAKYSGVSALAEAKEFLRVHSGEKSAFYKQLNEVKQTWSDEYIKEFVNDVLNAFIRYVENGLLEGITLQRRAQLDVVSDFLAQAERLLSSSDVHPAAPHRADRVVPDRG